MCWEPPPYNAYIAQGSQWGGFMLPRALQLDRAAVL